MTTFLNVLLQSFPLGYSVLGLIHLMVFIWALFNIIADPGLSFGGKLLWILIVLLLPLLGLILYYLIGGSSRSTI